MRDQLNLKKSLKTKLKYKYITVNNLKVRYNLKTEPAKKIDSQ